MPIPLLTYCAYTRERLSNVFIETGQSFVESVPSEEEQHCQDILFEMCLPEEPPYTDESDNGKKAFIVAVSVIGGVVMLRILFLLYRITKLQ
jgi:hypothetical protein